MLFAGIAVTTAFVSDMRIRLIQRKADAVGWSARRQPATIARCTLVAVVAILMAACTTDPDTGSISTTDSRPSTSIPANAVEVEPGTSATHRPPASNRAGGTFRMPVQSGLIPDPIHAKLEDSFILIAELWTGLMRLSQVGSDTVATEDLAERVSISEDGLEYTFTLRPGATFSDGTPLVASDFKWSWERALLEGSTDRPLSTLGVIAGATELAEGGSTELTGVRPVDDRTLIVRLEQPSSDFLMRLADPIAVVLSPENVREWSVDFSKVWTGFNPNAHPFTFDELPVGTGPFKLDRFEYFGKICEIVPNPRYIHEKAQLDRVIFVADLPEPKFTRIGPNSRVIDTTDDLQIKWHALQSGAIHAFEAWTDPAESGSSTGALDATIVRIPTAFATHVIAFNDEVAPFDDPKFREALIRAVPVTAYASITGDPVAETLAPRRFTLQPGNDDRLEWDTARAVSLLAGSRYPDWTTIELPYDDQSNFSQYAWRGVFDLWQSVLGVNVELIPLNSIHYRRYVERGDGGMFLAIVDAHYPDPMHVYTELAEAFDTQFRSGTFTEFRELVADAARQPDLARRAIALDAIDAFVQDRAIAVPVRWDFNRRYVVTHADVNGYAVPVFHAPRFRKVWLERD